MIYDEGFKEPPITVGEEIGKRIRDGQPFREALLGTVTQRLGDVVRRAGADPRPVTQAAREVARAAFRVTLGHGNASPVAAQVIALGLVRATSDLEAEAFEPIAGACRNLFELAFASHLDPLPIASNLLLGVIRGAREHFRDPFAWVGPAARGLLEVARKHGGSEARKLRALYLEGLEGVKLEIDVHGDPPGGRSLHRHGRRRS